VLNLTGVERGVAYQLDGGAAEAGPPVGSSARGGLASFLGFVRRLGVAEALAARVHLPIQERRSGFTVVQKSLALVAALAAGCRSARDSDFVLAGDPAAITAAGLPRWPHSSQFTRLLRAFRPQHVQALRQVVETVTATHSVTACPLARADGGAPCARRVRSPGSRRGGVATISQPIVRRDYTASTAS
jgi:hypothetical protein